MKIIAVLLTYNRLPLLKKCVQAVEQQTTKPDLIIIINNGSTDGTGAWLAGQRVTTYTQANSGGAGGFSFGIRQAYRQGADWIWLMDDDTIPRRDALEELLAALSRLSHHMDQIGFLSSKVLWTDGTPHHMNLHHVLKNKEKRARFSFARETDLPLVQFGTFVSMLLSARAVEKVGLPIKEYFIWSDDVEYSQRMINSGLAGIAVAESIATHETTTNFGSNVFSDPPASLPKFRYGLRNELFTKRLHEGRKAFWISWIHRMVMMPFRIAYNRTDHRWAFMKVMWKTSLAALFFHPSIEHVDRRDKGNSSNQLMEEPTT